MFFKNLFLIFYFLFFCLSVPGYVCEVDKEKIVPLSQDEIKAARNFFDEMQKCFRGNNLSCLARMIFYDSKKEESDLPTAGDIEIEMWKDRKILVLSRPWEFIGKEIEFLTPSGSIRGKFIHIALEYKGKRFVKATAIKLKENNRREVRNEHFAFLLLYHDRRGAWKIFIYNRLKPGTLFLDPS